MPRDEFMHERWYMKQPRAIKNDTRMARLFRETPKRVLFDLVVELAREAKGDRSIEFIRQRAKELH